MAVAITKTFINKPGGVLLHLLDGEVANFPYGAEVDPSIVAEHQREFLSEFTDNRDRGVSNVPEEARILAEEQARTAKAKDAVPANYGDLSEEEAIVLVQNEDDEFKQAKLVEYELGHANRTAVIDAATGKAVRRASKALGIAVPNSNPDGVVVISKDLKKDVLEAEAERRGLSTDGTKDDLVTRINEFDADNTPPPTS